MKQLQIIAGVIVLGLIVLFSSAFILDETKQAFITQFGKPVRGPISEPGMNFKVPFIQKVHVFDKRFLEWDGHPNQIPTRDKRYISIDTYARWRIKDPLIFFQNVTDELGAQTRLDDVLDGATRNAIARHDLVEIVRSRHREETLPDAEMVVIQDEEFGRLQDFQFGRDAIAKNVLTNAAVQLDAWGIELLDIRFKRINYEEDVKRKIFERMISERTRIAEKFRSEGQGEAQRIQGQRERELRSIQSQAFREVQEIQGRADAEAAAIYASAYNQNSQAQEFYRFLKTMESYGVTLSGKDMLVLSTKGDFYRYLRSPVPPEHQWESRYARPPVPPPVLGADARQE
jgi:modulator of FtsH protease HflC